jgi:hypothetical protein
MTKWGTRGKPNKLVTSLAKSLDHFYWPLSLSELFASVLLGWAALWNSGEHDWWMNVLLIFGITMSFVIGLVQVKSIAKTSY